MTVEIVVGGGALLLGLVVVGTIVGLWRGGRVEGRARDQLQATRDRGALPPSLHPKIDIGLCIGSGTCVEACPEDEVLAVVDGKAELVNPTACIGHGECLRACPVDAISLVLGHERRGVDIPMVATDFQTQVPGLYIVGELGGMGLIYNAMTQALQCMAAVRAELPPKVEGAHQVLIVGAGPAGIAASLSALEADLDFVTIEQESLGGTVLHYPRQKIVMTRPVIVPIYGSIRVTEITKEALLEVWEDVVETTGLSVRTGVKVERVIRAEDGLFDVDTSEGSVRAQRVILAMGRRGSPRKLGVPGEDLGKVTYRLVDPEHYANRKVMVVGGGDSAVEAAVALGDAGAQTQLCYRKAAFDRIKPKNGARLDAAVEAGRVELLLEATPAEIRPDQVVVRRGDGEEIHENDYVIVNIGGVLPTRFLEMSGVEVQTFRGEAFAPANR